MRPTRHAPIADSYVVPGTHLVAGEYPGSPPNIPREQAHARLHAFLQAGITHFLDLTTPADHMTPYAATLQQLASAQGRTITHAYHGIPDMGICAPAQLNQILDAIDAAQARDEGTYVHCWGGVGRTGMVVGCWLVRRGLTGTEALREVGRLFGTMSPAKLAKHAEWGSPQTEDQREVVRTWAAHDRVLRAAVAGAAEAALG